MRVPSPLLLSLLAAVPAAAASQSAPPASLPASSPARIEVRATGKPLAEVLDQIARQTGMKVTYEGGTPRGRVTTNLPSVTPAQAVVSVMEGLDLNYLMGLDATSTRVETLLVVSHSSSSRPVAARSPGATSSRMPQPSGEEMPEEAEAPEDDPMTGAITEAMPADANDPMGPAEMVAPPGSGAGANRGAEEQKPQPFQPGPPVGPTGLGWSASPGSTATAPVIPHGAPNAVNPMPQPGPVPVPVPGATPPPPNK